jgi:peptidoglycan/LPS O-acetylase OafA/YrhL
MQYRSDIDGLRAMAVLPVIFFHAGFLLFQGGFVGVDVFFVISGYLITSIILSSLELNTFSLKSFYINRARRLLPSLLFMLSICIPMALLILLPNDIIFFFKSVLATLFFFSNILFWSQTGYFGSAAELEPLIHTWSLGIEEQYYLIFPIFLMFLWRFRKNIIFSSLLIIMCLSFFLAAVGPDMFNFSRTTAYFMLPTRGWEILLGAVAAILASKSQLINIHILFSNFLVTLGMLMILAPIFFFSENTPYPGPYTLIPTLGTFLILLFNTQKTLVHYFLSLKFLVYVGLISYSLYLWHQPLLALSRNFLMVHLPLHITFAAIISSFLMAIFSYHIVESPFRSKKKIQDKKFLFIVGISILVLVSISILGISKKGFAESYYKKLSPQSKIFLTYLDYKNTSIYKEEYSDGKCFYDSQKNSFEEFNIENCLAIQTSQSNILLMGDSFAAHYSGALKREYPEVNFLQATSTYCKPLINEIANNSCSELFNYIFLDFIPSNNIDAIILSGRWDPEDILGIQETLAFLKQFDVTIFLIGPSPEFATDVPRILAKLNNQLDAKQATLNFASTKILATNTDLSKILLSNKDAKFLNSYNALCDQSDCTILTPEGVPIIFDYGHFTAEGASYVLNQMIELKEYADELR